MDELVLLVIQLLGKTGEPTKIYLEGSIECYKLAVPMFVGVPVATDRHCNSLVCAYDELTFVERQTINARDNCELHSLDV